MEYKPIKIVRTKKVQVTRADELELEDVKEILVKHGFDLSKDISKRSRDDKTIFEQRIN